MACSPPAPSGATPDRPSAAGAGSPQLGTGSPQLGTGSPQLRLAAAVSAGQGISCRVKNTIIVRSQPASPSIVVTGAFDPATTTGYLFFASGDAQPWSEQRLVHGDLYTAELVHIRPVPSDLKGKPAPGADQRVDCSHDPSKKYTNFSYDLKTGVLSLSADPQQLLDALTRSGAKISQAGPGRYHFEVAIPPREGLTGGTRAGDVTVGSDKRIAKVGYRATEHFATETAVLDGMLQTGDRGTPRRHSRAGSRQVISR